MATLPSLAATVPFFMAMGNHDTGPGHGRGAVWNALFALPANNPDRVEDYFSLVVGNVLVAGLSSYTYDFAAQIDWLDRELAAHADDVVWRILFLHTPVWSSGRHGSNEDGRALPAALLPVVEARGVDLVIAGHDHNYERFHPSRGGFGRPRTIRPLPELDGRRGTAEGVVYLTSGGGGAPVSPILFGREEGSAETSNHLHYLRLDVAGATLTSAMRDMGPQRDAPGPDGPRDFDVITLHKQGTACPAEGRDSGQGPGEETGRRPEAGPGRPVEVADAARPVASRPQAPGGRGCACRTTGPAPGLGRLVWRLVLGRRADHLPSDWDLGRRDRE
jgi:hypothetical protein